MSDNGMNDFSDSPHQGGFGEDSNGNWADPGNGALNVLDHQQVVKAPSAMSLFKDRKTYGDGIKNMYGDVKSGGFSSLGANLKMDWNAINDKTTMTSSRLDSEKGKYESFLQKSKGAVGIDPLKWLVGTLVDFLVQTFQPLEDLLGVVTGNESRMTVSSNMWQEVGNAMPPISDHMNTVVANELASWEGAAGEGARTRVMELGLMLQAMGFLAYGMQGVLQMFAGIAKALRKFVEKLITDGVVWVIQRVAPMMAASVATLGAAAPVCIAMTVAKIAGLVLDAIQMIQGAIQVFQGLGETFSLIQEVFSIFQPFVADLVSVP